MKRLYVGCRVRILWSRKFPELAGQEGRIVPVPTGINPFNGHTYTNLSGRPWAVAPDCWGHPSPPSGESYWFSPFPEQLEPIQDPGHQVISWADMEGLWQPKGVEA